MVDLAVYIINYNTTELTKNAIRSVVKYCPKVDVYLLDNSSEFDENLINFSANIPKVKYFGSDKNLGFAGGMNYLIDIGINHGKRVHFFMNSDAELVDDSLFNAYNALTKGRYSVLGLINVTSRGVVWQAGKNIKFSGLFFTDSKASEGVFTECDYVPGSSLLTTTDTYLRVGGLHEEYFAYYEEVEYCLNVKRSGGKVAYLNGSRIYHEPGRSSSSRLKVYLKIRNRMYFIKRNFPRFLKLKNFLIVSIFLIRKPKYSLHNFDIILKAVKDYNVGNMYLNAKVR